MRNVISVVRKFMVAASLLSLATLAFSANPVFGQSTSGEIVGTVKDASGAVLPNATITLTSESTNVSVTTTSSGSGEFHIQNLPAALYDMKVALSGFAPYTLKAIAVEPSKSATVNANLSVGSTSSVEVSADSGVVLDTTTTNLTTTFSNVEASVLPTATIGLGILNASLLSPNVASSGGIGIGTGPSVGGQRPRNNNYTVEGIDDNDKGVTGPLLTVPNDAVGDFTLITSQFSPEFGHSSGGQFNTNVISGSNKLHGRVYEYFQNRNLNAENAIQGGKVSNPRFDQNRYGGQVGGPIRKDKLFVFGNYERFTQGQTLQGFLCTPTAAGFATLNSLVGPYGLNATNVAQYAKYLPASPSQISAADDVACGNQASGPQSLAVFNNVVEGPAPYGATGLNNGHVLGSVGAPGQLETFIPLGNYLLTAPAFTNTDQITTSADYTLSASDSFRFRYIYFTEGTQDLAASLPIFFQSTPLKQHLMSFGEFHNFTPNLNNEIRIGYNRSASITPVGNFAYPGLDAFPNLTLGDQNSLNLGPDPNGPQSATQNLYQLVDNVSYSKGTHSIKIGFDGRKYIAPQTFTQRVRGDYEYDYVTEFFHDLAPTSFGQRSTGNFIYYGDQTALYGYANDTWRVSPKITLNYGLRYEFTSVPVGERAQALNSAASVPGVLTFAAPKPGYKNFGPRVGIAFAPDSKTSIRLGYGISYDVLFDNLGLLSFPPQYSSTNSVGDANTNYTGKVNPNFGDPNFLTNGGLPPGNGGLATFSTLAKQRAATAAFLPDQVLPYAENYNLTIQRTIGSNYTAEIQYLGTRGIHLATQIQLNKQPKVTAANQLTTYTTGPTVDASGGFATISTGATANTLATINAASAVVPLYANAGFTSTITSYQPFSQSDYNGLGLNLTRRFHNGFQMNASYTWSKTMDDATAEVFATVLTPRRQQNSQCISCDYSRSALDRTNRFTFEAVYDVPYFKHSNYLLKNVVGNWQVAPIYTYESPEYVTVLSGVNSNLNGDSATIDRTIINPTGNKAAGSGVLSVYSNNPTLVAACGAGVSQCAANQVGYLATNPNAYYITAGKGTLPTAGRNTLPGNPINNFDLSALKRINITERYAFEFHAQAINLFNHAQYVPGFPDVINTSSTAGIPTSYQTAGSPNFNKPGLVFTANARFMQLAAKFIF